MGCDIHLYTEKKISHDSRQWVSFDNWKVNEYFPDEEGYESKYDCRHAYRDRNYELFGALAGVRSDVCEFIPPRGMPADVSEQVREESERLGEDGHSHSWLTMQEVLDHKTKIGNSIKRSGMVSPDQAERLDAGDTPDSWCQATTDVSFVYREWIERDYNPMDSLVEQIDSFLKSSMYTFQYEDLDMSNIRIVFWFDN